MASTLGMTIFLLKVSAWERKLQNSCERNVLTTGSFFCSLVITPLLLSLAVRPSLPMDILVPHGRN
jgi:hypothetical protein